MCFHVGFIRESCIAVFTQKSLDVVSFIEMQSEFIFTCELLYAVVTMVSENTRKILRGLPAMLV